MRTSGKIWTIICVAVWVILFIIFPLQWVLYDHTERIEAEIWLPKDFQPMNPIPEILDKNGAAIKPQVLAGTEEFDNIKRIDNFYVGIKEAADSITISYLAVGPDTNYRGNKIAYSYEQVIRCDEPISVGGHVIRDEGKVIDLQEGYIAFTTEYQCAGSIALYLVITLLGGLIIWLFGALAIEL